MYYTGHIKRDPESGASALRTIFPEDQGPQLANMAWLVGTPNTGARHAPTSEVDGWDDLFVATDPNTAPEPEPEPGS